MTTREEITAALLQFAEADLYDAGINLFDVLGYNTSRTEKLDDNTIQGFAEMFIREGEEFKAEVHAHDEDSLAAARTACMKNSRLPSPPAMALGSQCRTLSPASAQAARRRCST